MARRFLVENDIREEKIPQKKQRQPHAETRSRGGKKNRMGTGASGEDFRNRFVLEMVIGSMGFDAMVFAFPLRASASPREILLAINRCEIVHAQDFAPCNGLEFP